MKIAPFVLVLSLAWPAAQLHAQNQRPASASAPSISVSIGPHLAALSSRYGASELGYLRKELAAQVARAALRGGFTRVDLVLQDATPNRPTPEMRSKIHPVDLSSSSLGGATITGVAYGPAGEQPLKSSFYETSFRSEIASGVWFDAERAFGFLAADLAKGRAPQKFGPNTPPNIEGSLNPLDPSVFPK